jgi:hypothetical protein
MAPTQRDERDTTATTLIEIYCRALARCHMLDCVDHGCTSSILLSPKNLSLVRLSRTSKLHSERSDLIVSSTAERPTSSQ